MRVVDPARSTVSTRPRIVSRRTKTTRLVQQATVGSPPYEGSTHHHQFLQRPHVHFARGTPLTAPLDRSRYRSRGPYTAHCSKAPPHRRQLSTQPGSAYLALRAIPSCLSHPHHKKRPPHSEVGALGLSHLSTGSIRTRRVRGVQSPIWEVQASGAPLSPTRTQGQLARLREVHKVRE